MKRAVAVRLAGQWNTATSVDRVTLDSSERHRRRIMLTGDHGLAFLLDLEQATMLRNGDGLELDDGAIVTVAGKPERLVEIFARGARDIARLAWHIGNRHTEVQIVGDRLRIRRNHVLEDMIAAFGAELSPIEAVFDPEPVGGEGHGLPHERHHEHGHSHAP